MRYENSLSHRVVPGRTCGVEHMDSRKKFAVAVDSTCANCRDGGAGYPKPGHRAGVGGFQTDSAAVEGTISCPSFGRIEERCPAARPYPKYPREKSAGVVQATLHTTPRGPTHWSNGTTTLFAALSMLDGKVIGDCMPRHRHQEFIRFLNKIDAETPSDLDLHLIVDNYATHKHPRVKSWMRRHPRFHIHFIPTSSSW